jgi:hypothetical protein
VQLLHQPVASMPDTVSTGNYDSHPELVDEDDSEEV